MRPVFLLLLLVQPVLAAAPTAPVERIFDIVPSEGAKLEMVDGLTVLRQQGTKFGAVLTYMPESATSAWIPMAVLNTSGGELKVGTRGVSARSGDAPLKVWSTTALVRLAKEGRISAPADLVESAGRDGTPLYAGGEAPTAPTAAPTIGPQQPGTQTQTTSRVGSKVSRNNDQEKRHDLAVAQVTALRERLFRDETLDARQLGRGDVRIDLPPQREGDPAEFVLTLEFGDERMDVRYRERVPAAAP
jgi:hypothetical protein